MRMGPISPQRKIDRRLVTDALLRAGQQNRTEKLDAKVQPAKKEFIERYLLLPGETFSSFIDRIIDEYMKAICRSEDLPEHDPFIRLALRLLDTVRLARADKVFTRDEVLAIVQPTSDLLQKITHAEVEEAVA